MQGDKLFLGGLSDLNLGVYDGLTLYYAHLADSYSTVLPISASNSCSTEGSLHAYKCLVHSRTPGENYQVSAGPAKTKKIMHARAPSGGSRSRDLSACFVVELLPQQVDV